jgi:GxxExxY protein
MAFDPESLNPITRTIIGAAIAVHKALGPGLLESAYHVCLCRELKLQSVAFETRRRIPISYRGEPLDVHYEADIIVEDKVLIEVKAVSPLLPVHTAQVITYLKLTRLPLGLLINFNVPFLCDGVRRLLNPDLNQPSRHHETRELVRSMESEGSKNNN